MIAAIVIDKNSYNMIKTELYKVKLDSFKQFIKFLSKNKIFDHSFIGKINVLYNLRSILSNSINIIKVLDSLAEVNIVDIVSSEELFKLFKRTKYKCCNRDYEFLVKKGNMFTSYCGIISLFSHLRSKKYDTAFSSLRNIAMVYKFCYYEYFNYKTNNKLFILKQTLKQTTQKNKEQELLINLLFNENKINEIATISQDNISIPDIELISGIDVESSYEYLSNYITDLDKII